MKPPRLRSLNVPQRGLCEFHRQAQVSIPPREPARHRQRLAAPHLEQRLQRGEVLSWCSHKVSIGQPATLLPTRYCVTTVHRHPHSRLVSRARRLPPGIRGVCASPHRTVIPSLDKHACCRAAICGTPAVRRHASPQQEYLLARRGESELSRTEGETSTRGSAPVEAVRQRLLLWDICSEEMAPLRTKSREEDGKPWVCVASSTREASLFSKPTPTPEQYRESRESRLEHSYEAMLSSGRQSWTIGERVRV